MTWPTLVPALMVPFFCALVYVVWVPHGNEGRSSYGLTKIWVLVYPLFFFGWIGLGGLTRREDRRVVWPSWKVVVSSGLASGVIMCLFGLAMVYSPIGDVIRENAHKVGGMADSLGFRKNFVFFATFVVVVHSAMEEYYWRWFVYGHLRVKVGRWFGHLITAIAFGGHHFVLTMQFFPTPLAVFLTCLVMIGGLLWSVMYEWHGTVVGCWLSHLVADAFLMIVGYNLINAGS